MFNIFYRAKRISKQQDAFRCAGFKHDLTTAEYNAVRRHCIRNMAISGLDTPFEQPDFWGNNGRIRFKLKAPLRIRLARAASFSGFSRLRR